MGRMSGVVKWSTLGGIDQLPRSNRDSGSGNRKRMQKSLKIKILFLLLAALSLHFFLVHSSLADSFVNTGALNNPRSSPTATLLPTGQVLIAGGGAPGSFGRNQFTSTLPVSTPA